MVKRLLFCLFGLVFLTEKCVYGHFSLLNLSALYRVVNCLLKVQNRQYFSKCNNLR